MSEEQERVDVDVAIVRHALIHGNLHERGVEAPLTRVLSRLRDAEETLARAEEALHDRKTWTFDTVTWVADRLLEHYYPEAIFPDDPGEEKGDAGPQLIRAIRRVRKIESARVSDPTPSPSEGAA